jgi:membrane carboxypeptidase/penicillin-binding protein
MHNNKKGNARLSETPLPRKMDDQTEAGALARYRARLNEIQDHPELDAEMIREARRVYDDELERIEELQTKTTVKRIVQRFSRGVVNEELNRTDRSNRYWMPLMDLDRSVHVDSKIHPFADIKVGDLRGIPRFVVKKLKALGFGHEIEQEKIERNNWGKVISTTPAKLCGVFKWID